MNRRIHLFAITLLLAACSREEDPFTEPSVSERPASETVSLCFRLSGRIADTRAAEDEIIRQEEGEVQSLSYAVFKDNMFEIGENVDLINRIQTGNEYLVSNLDKELFDETTEIFAIANASDDLKKTLLITPAPELKLDNPILAQKVESYIDLQAKISTYDFLIGRQLVKDAQKRPIAYPVDEYIYFLPANKGNRIDKQYIFATEGISFDSYATLIENRDKEKDLAKRAIYDMIVEDLECRLPLFQSGKYNEFKNTYNRQETDSLKFSQKLAKDANFTRYVQWHGLVCGENLNETTANSATRLIGTPLMAGYLSLTDEPGAIITVRVEHIYSRVWFQLGFTGEATAPDITIDKIEVAGLPQQTKVFNTAKVPAENNIEGTFSDADATLCISYEDTQAQIPFLADLTKNEAPWHLTDDAGGDIPLLRFVPAYPSYNVVCRYLPLEGSTDLDINKRPVRYYLYSYQWGGMDSNDDPVVTVTYHYTETAGDTETVVRKRAVARLYDENHAGGKLHHGVLRNYTYKVNCRINTASSDLEIQVIPNDWYHFEVDDIPSFD